MKRREFIKTVSLTLGSLSILPGCDSVLKDDTNHRKPNIVYILADDLGWTDLGFMGSKYYESPNLDKLASSGIVFTNAYAPAANCAPSRACCMTGQYTPRHGVYTVNSSQRGESKNRKLIPTKNTLHIKPENLTIANVLRSAGYKTCSIGKWHLSNDPTQNGFDINIAGDHNGSPRHGGYHSPYDYPNCIKDEKGEYLTDRLATEAIKFIRQNKANPFFLYLTHYSVHSPLQPKPDKLAQFAEKKTTKAHNNPKYAAMIASLDESVGRVMQTLKQLDLERDTLVLFTSDNGGAFNFTKQWPLRAGKGSYYEGGIREPMIVRWIGRTKAGQTCDVPVSGIDFSPTFLAAAGIEKPQDKLLDGVNLMPLIKGAKTIDERPLFWHFPIYLQGGNVESQDPKFRTRPGSAIRYGDWKLIEYFEEGVLELYNLKDDISEKKNMAKTNPQKVQQLHEILKNWRKETNAPMPTKLNPEYKA
jgi:arylsulfatase A-like enzyme